MTEPLSPARRRLVLIATILASSLGFIDGSVVSVAIPAIRSDLGASFSQIQWVANAYTLLLSALVLVGGAAGDRFGQARMFGAGIAVFSLTSIGCALAGSAEQLIAWRAVQGLGAAFMVPGSLALIARSYPADQRGKAIGLWSMASGIAAALGPILGGFLIDAGGAPAWRWIFWINPLPGLITLAFLYLARIPDDSKKRASLDIPGALLATFGLGALAFGLSQASEAGVNVVSVAAWLVAGTLALLTFLLWEARSPAPMLPLSLFRIRTFNGANLLTFFLYFALAGSLFFLPMTLIEALSLPEAHAGSVYLPFTVVMAVVARLSGGMTDRLADHRPVIPGGRGRCILPCLRTRRAAGDGRARRGHGFCRRSPVDDGDDGRGRLARRHSLRSQQRHFTHRRPVRGRGSRNRGGTRLSQRPRSGAGTRKLRRTCRGLV